MSDAAHPSALLVWCPRRARPSVAGCSTGESLACGSPRSRWACPCPWSRWSPRLICRYDLIRMRCQGCPLLPTLLPVLHREVDILFFEHLIDIIEQVVDAGLELLIGLGCSRQVLDHFFLVADALLALQFSFGHCWLPSVCMLHGAPCSILFSYAAIL